jgi:uncharacterized protein YjbI with pentapeptide repeats
LPSHAILRNLRLIFLLLAPQGGDMPAIELPPGLSGLLGIIKRAQTAVPAVKYALGLVGVAAAAAAISIILGHERSSIILVILTLAGMVILFVFSKLVASGASASVQAAANVVLWTVVLLFSAALVSGFTAVTAHWPPGMYEFIFPKSELSDSELLQKVFLHDDVVEAEAAVTEIMKRCKADCKDRDEITKSLAGTLRSTHHLDRELNVAILSALKVLSNNSLKTVLASDSLEGTELVEVDFSSADLSNMSLKDTFLILSKMRDANLAGADLSGASLRGTNFGGAVFKETSMSNADWFNAFNFTKAQMEGVVGDVKKCPTPFNDPSFRAFIDEVNRTYGITYENYGSSHRAKLNDQWRKYGAPGGLCEFVKHRSSHP